MSRYDRWLENLKKEITVTINRMENEPDFAETGTMTLKEFATQILLVKKLGLKD